jgi:hypothetical protein
MPLFKNDDAAIGFSWFSLWVLFGAFALWVHNLLLPYLFLGYAALVYVAHLYLNCTRCAYFEKQCCLLGGLLSPKLFKARPQSHKEPDDSISSALWFTLGIFPAPFLLYYQDWFLLLVYCVVTYGWFYYRKTILCKKCDNGWCPGKR